MAVLTGTDEWSPIYKIDTSDPVKGGTISGTLDAPTDGYANAQAQSAANRFLWLYNRMTPIGTLAMWPTSIAPTGWLICDGSQVSRTTYASLFAVVGTVFGQGNGTTTFHLPDARGRFPRGYSGLSGLDPDAASRTAMNTGGATGNNIGSVQDDAFEAHNHGGGDHRHSVSVKSDAADDTGQGALADGTNNHYGNDGWDGYTELSGDIITSNGGNETRPKNFAINYIIRADY